MPSRRVTSRREFTLSGRLWHLAWTVICSVFVAVWLGIVAFGWLGDAVGGHAASDDTGVSDGVSATGNASDNDFTITSLNTDYRLTRGADRRAELAVTETIHARFSDEDLNHGILRAIPNTADGRSLHLEVDDVRAADGTWIMSQTEQQPGFTVLRIGDPDEFVHGDKTYVITYTMRDVIQQQAFGGAQRFDFDVNGTGWAVPFDRVTATLHVSGPLAGSLSGEKACYQGAQGSRATCAISRDGSDFTMTAGRLGPHQNATMVVGFTNGAFAVPISVPRLIVWILLGLAVVVLALAIVVRFRSLGNPKGTGIIVPQYAAFPGIGVMEAAELLDERDRAFPALVTELVVARAATMTRDDHGTEKTADDVYALRLLDGSLLDDDDSAAVATLFGSLKHGTKVSLDADDPKIGDRVVKLLQDARLSVRKQGLIARRHTALSTALLVLGFVLPFLAIILGAGLISTGLGSWVHDIAVGAVIVFGVAAIVFVWPRERLTEKAIPAYEHLLGIRDYLRLAEADRIRMLQSPGGAETTAAADGTQLVKLYERLLPYAILFNIEKEWREVLGRYWATTPTEVSPTLLPLQTIAFTSAFASSQYATTASTSTSSGSNSWSGSGGSSFSGGGGGFSGGGFGGGGGGGW